MNFAATDKWRRLKKAHHNLKYFYTANPRGIDNTEAKDAAEDFFTQCYHLKDWLIKDQSVKIVSDVEKYITGCKGLSIAADICNSFKHAGLDRKSRSGKKIDEMLTHMKIDLVENRRRFESSSRIEIIIDGTKQDALDLADQCMIEWKAFFKQDNISLPEP